MEIVSLELALEPLFWEHINQDIPHYYFFALDWKYNKDATKILLALEGSQIFGMMLIYRQSIVQLRGSYNAVKALLEKLDLKKVELLALEQYKQDILKKYKPTVSYEIILMTLHEGEEKFQETHPVVPLNATDAEQIAPIMNNADLETWGTVTNQQIVEEMQNVIWVGIKVERELVSIGKARLTEWGGHIGVIATHKAHRNRGYATSVVSNLVKQIMEKQSLAMIYVDSNNQPAIRAYKKVGFKPYRKYFFVKGEKK